MNPQCTYVCGSIHTQAYPISPDVWQCQLRHSSRSRRLSLLFCVTADQSLTLSCMQTVCRLLCVSTSCMNMFHTSMSAHTVHIHMELHTQSRAYAVSHISCTCVYSLFLSSRVCRCYVHTCCLLLKKLLDVCDEVYSLGLYGRCKYILCDMHELFIKNDGLFLFLHCKPSRLNLFNGFQNVVGTKMTLGKSGEDMRTLWY